MANLEEEYKYYTDHQDELAEKYAGKFLVIKDKEIKGSYNTEIEAYENTKVQYELGTFLIKPCLPKSANETQIFHTRAFL